MEHFQISCESCERGWNLAGNFTIYQQQAIESRPCPHCGACTLNCHEPGQKPLEKPHPRHYLANAS